MKEPLFKKLLQVGMVVSDLESSMKKYVYDYGIGPMYALKFNSGNVSHMSIYGKPKKYSMNIGVCPIGDIRFELIEPLSDSIYSEFLARNGEGIIHHLKLDVENYDQTLKYFDFVGIDSIQSGHQLGDRGESIYNYLETSKRLEFICEITDVSDDFIKPQPDQWYPQKRDYVPIFKRPTHAGIIVKDLNRKIKEYSDYFSMKDWYVKKFDSGLIENTYIHGKRKDYSVKIAFYELGNVLIKLIEPLDESIYTEFYNKYGDGIIHHLGMEVDNYASDLDKLKSKGLKVLQSGIYLDRTRYAYISTDHEINFITEIVENSGTRFLP